MKADQLQGYLARSAKDRRLDPFWLLTGSDAFLAVEAGDAIRAEARRQGYTDRQVLDMNASADWSRLPMAAADRRRASLHGESGQERRARHREVS